MFTPVTLAEKTLPAQTRTSNPIIEMSFFI
jgi:hypothetical protein